MVAESEKSSGGEAAAAVVVGPSNHHKSRRRRSFNKPSWLLCTIADLDEKMKSLTGNLPKQETSDSFASMADSYYRERPQLLSLLHDLYNGYLSLADRYCQLVKKSRHKKTRCSSPITSEGEVIDSDADSSLSFQPPTVSPVDIDTVIAALVMKTVEYDIAVNELTGVEKRWRESSKKVELQRNLLDLLESERAILLNENVALGYRVAALAEENKGLASESLFLKRKAAEVAQCVLKMSENRKIEDLFGGRGLSKCFSFDMKRVDRGNVNEGGKASTLWKKVKKFNLFRFDSSGSCEKKKHVSMKL